MEEFLCDNQFRKDHAEVVEAQVTQNSDDGSVQEFRERVFNFRPG